MSEVYYNLIDSNGAFIKKLSGICFHHLSHLDKSDFERIKAINFKVKAVNNSKEEVSLYVEELKVIGFHIHQTAEDILENGYLLELKYFEQPNGICASEVLAHLTVIRYIQEFSLIISRFLNLLEKRPKINRWDAFRLAHMYEVSGSHVGNKFFGSGHCLLLWPYNSGLPCKSWETVRKSISKTAGTWRTNFSWSINATYGGSISKDRHELLMSPKIRIEMIKNKSDITKALALLKFMEQE